MPAESTSSIPLLQLNKSDVRQLFQRTVLRREKPPTEAACQRVAEVMNGRNWFHRVITGPIPGFHGHDSAIKDFLSASQRLLNTSNKLKVSYKDKVDLYTTNFPLDLASVANSGSWDNSAFEALEAAILSAATYVQSKTLGVGFDWDLEVQLLGIVFDEAMHSSTPGKTFGNSSAGPRLRFIRAGLKLVANIETNEAAIKTRLARIAEHGNSDGE